MVKPYFFSFEGVITVVKLSVRLKQLLWSIKYAFQRAVRGYDDRAVFSLDTSFQGTYLAILKDFKANLHSYPGNMSPQQWNEVLDSLIFHLSRIEDDNLTYDEQEKSKNEFFKLFSEHFFDLWD